MAFNPNDGSETRLPTGQVKTKYSTDLYSDVIYDNIYEFCTHAYEGTGGFLTGDYLVKHDKEYDTNKRRRISTYKNYIKGIVDSLLTPVFANDAFRATDNQIFQDFLFNVDAKGNDIQKFTHNVVKFTKLHGVTFVVMDNYSNIPDTIKEVLDQRAYPYMYQVTADQVIDYKVDKNGVLNSLTFVSGCDKEGNRKVTTVTDKYFVEGVEIDGEVTIKSNKKYHKLGTIPVISLYDTLSTEVLPFPPTYDLCRINWTVYNQDSEQRVVERNSAFAMLTLDSGGEEHDVNLDIGSDTLLVYGRMDKQVNKPEWIAPPTQILQNMLEISNNTVEKLLEAAAMIGSQAVSASTTSAKHEAYKFIGTHYAIQHTARLAEEFETMVAELFGLYINTDIAYEVVYQDTYLPSEIEITEKINNYKAVLELDISETAKAQLKEQISQEVLNMFNIEQNN